MRIAVTSQNFRSITSHAGMTRRFLIYETQPDGGVAEIDRLDLPKSMSLHQYHGADHPLYGLDVVVTGGCGEGFVQRLGAYGVRVIATAETDPLKAATAVAAGEELVPALLHEH